MNVYYFAAHCLSRLIISIIRHYGKRSLCHINIYLLETSFNTFTIRADPDQAAIVAA